MCFIKTVLLQLRWHSGESNPTIYKILCLSVFLWLPYRQLFLGKVDVSSLLSLTYYQDFNGKKRCLGSYRGHNRNILKKNTFFLPLSVLPLKMSAVEVTAVSQIESTANVSLLRGANKCSSNVVGFCTTWLTRSGKVKMCNLKFPST